MSHIAFFNVPAHGHVNPTLAVVVELVSRGHRVTYAVPEEFHDAVRHVGATPVPYTSSLPTGDQEWPEEAAPAMALFLDEARVVLPQLEAAYAADVPDLVVYDIGAWTARLLAARWGVPAVQFSPTFVAYEGWEETLADPDVDRFFDVLDRWLAEQGVDTPGRDYVGRPDRAVVSITRTFQFQSDTVDPLYAFVGPCLGDRSYQGGWQPKGRTLLVSLGSAFTNRLDLYRNVVEAFGDTDWHVVLNVGRLVDPALLGDLPDNVEVHRWVPQLAILAHASLFVTHCGMGGTMEGLYHGVPMIGVPTIGEQHLNAQRLVELGVGRHLPDPSIEDLRTAARELTEDPDVARRLAELRQEAREAGGARAAADVLEATL
ncbi:glycosyltransferase [Saccharothrix violaceirubra]|uniref:MGT family glycosyltransferase n=1 Tax=Saccharothrix violaceirubra TaxID=413306 RepID=A0A7W7T754_9PSEU|nr:macrolide family glycosyltransferase [Saccharothrix violaceirubra]MBB4967813.1 MGT family glycosyltransferase [Saccharothrix violaceirubra]